MDVETLSPHLCAKEILETVPTVMNYIRTEIRAGSFSSSSVLQVRVLSFVKRYPLSSLTDVSEHLGITKPTASSTVDRMVQQGLIQREEHPSERRRITLQLTPAGAEQIETITGEIQETLAALMKNLSLTDLSKIAEGLKRLREVF